MTGARSGLRCEADGCIWTLAERDNQEMEDRRYKIRLTLFGPPPAFFYVFRCVTFVRENHDWHDGDASGRPELNQMPIQMPLRVG